MNTRGEKKQDEEQELYFELQDSLQSTSSPTTTTQGQLADILSQLVVTQQTEERLVQLQEIQWAKEWQQDERLAQMVTDRK